jgi:hypothetical protein
VGADRKSLRARTGQLVDGVIRRGTA